MQKWEEILREVEPFRIDRHARAACNLGEEFLECTHQILTDLCVLPAALGQRKINRVTLAGEFKDLYCYSEFSHTDPENLVNNHSSLALVGTVSGSRGLEDIFNMQLLFCCVCVN